MTNFDADFDVELLRQLQKKDIIACSLLARTVGYPGPYKAAEKMLEEEGWYYSIGNDAWFRRVGFV